VPLSQKIMHGFGCQILACDPQENEELIQQTNLSYTTLEDVCKNSDVISVHCPLNPETKYMFNKKQFYADEKELSLLILQEELSSTHGGFNRHSKWEI
jgi:lactate dehydrogenase-like 2-hydroxyacid dehydrogenase